MDRPTIVPLNPTIDAILTLQKEVDDLRRTVTKLIAILKANAERTL